MPVLLLLVLALIGMLTAPPVVEAKRLGAWGEYVVILQKDGQVWGVGKNSIGQLGLGTASKAVTFPTMMKNVVQASDVAAATIHTCIVDRNGQARCVGKDNYGQLGDGTTKDKTLLSFVSGLGSGVAQVFCSPASSCALLTSGAAKCWGYNTGNLGDGTLINRLVPISVKGFESSGLKDIAMGSTHTCFLTTLGRVLCTGYNLYGQLGDGTKNHRAYPAQIASVSGTSTFSSVSTGISHTCASSLKDGLVFCWGAGMYGQLGSGDLANSVLPVRVLGLRAAPVSVWATSSTSFVLMSNLVVMGFGENPSGSLGNGNTKYQTTPVNFNRGNIVEVRGGNPTTCVMDDMDLVYCVGGNGYGQLGLPVTTSLSLQVLKMQGLPTMRPTAKWTYGPTQSPTKPTQKPTAPTKKQSTLKPTKQPTSKPSQRPTKQPTAKVTKQPTSKPSQRPTKQPTAKGTNQPTAKVTNQPTAKVTNQPTAKATNQPTLEPSQRPTNQPTAKVTKQPTKLPTMKGQTFKPTSRPTFQPTSPTTLQPTNRPTTPMPTKKPTTAKPTNKVTG
ncbi:hypothetical protein BASA81_006837 [Batrachochytrium salamandrivorans]|nr:hypothetical protein BASA81_006837 [Batrachochytrium salamandrivorans]